MPFTCPFREVDKKEGFIRLFLGSLKLFNLFPRACHAGNPAADLYSMLDLICYHFDLLVTTHINNRLLPSSVLTRRIKLKTFWLAISNKLAREAYILHTFLIRSIAQKIYRNGNLHVCSHENYVSCSAEIVSRTE